jgi:radical SAM-linked protein
MSQGYRPHMKMAFGPPLAVGHSSLAEYVDLEFERPPAADLVEALNPLFPDGLAVTGWHPILYRASSLMSVLDTAAYRVRFTDEYLVEGGLEPSALEDRLSEAIVRLTECESIPIQRKAKDGMKEMDIRPSIETVEPLSTGRGLDCWIRFVPRSQARPEEILSVLLPGPDPRLARVERTGLWATAGDRRSDPFELLSAAAPLGERSRAMG